MCFCVGGLVVIIISVVLVLVLDFVFAFVSVASGVVASSIAHLLFFCSLVWALLARRPWGLS